MNNDISDKDKKDWQSFINNNDNIEDKDLFQSEVKKIKTKSFDLHGYSLDEANKEIENIIKDSYNNGVAKLIIVTGKGLHSQNDQDPYVSKDFGILKYSVPEFIKNNRELSSLIYDIRDANIEDGGSGAFYIFLKKTIK